MSMSVIYLCWLQLLQVDGYVGISSDKMGTNHLRFGRSRHERNICTPIIPKNYRNCAGSLRRTTKRLNYIEYDKEDGNYGEDDDEKDAIEEKVIEIVNSLGSNPIARIFTNSYSFFWNLPKKSMPFDTPWVFLRNSSAEFISWYQFPHNLPPYRYVGEDQGFRADMFAYGLPGNTLPLGNWDPFGFQCVDKKILIKYRESELKHGRLAMLACLGFIMQEFHHPLHSDIGGMSITHMAQLQHLSDGASIFKNALPGAKHLLHIISKVTGDSTSEASRQMIPDGSVVETYPFISLDYIFVVLILALFELQALSTKWIRWRPDEYNHQFEHNMGVGNLKAEYTNGDYGFDVLGLMPTGNRAKRRAIEKELNHGRIAMIAIVGMIGQEYFTGVSVHETIVNFFDGDNGADTYTTINTPGFLSQLSSISNFIQEQLSQSGMSVEAPIPAMK